MIDAADLGFRYGGDWVFRHHSFTIQKGSVVAILGPNGRGKTTLVKALIGLHRPAEGAVSLRGAVGYVPQTAGTAFAYKVIDMVVMGRARHLSLFATPSRDDFARAHQSLAELGADHLADRSYDTLSGGERQLVLIARALCSDCSILVLDEPASALDFKNQDTILRTLSRVSRERGLTVVLTTHYPQHALYLADDVLLMFSTEHYRFGPARELLSEEQLTALYGLPIRIVDVDQQSSRTAVPLFGSDR